MQVSELGGILSRCCSPRQDNFLEVMSLTPCTSAAFLETIRVFHPGPCLALDIHPGWANSPSGPEASLWVQTRLLVSHDKCWTLPAGKSLLSLGYSPRGKPDGAGGCWRGLSWCFQPSRTTGFGPRWFSRCLDLQAEGWFLSYQAGLSWCLEIGLLWNQEGKRTRLNMEINEECVFIVVW